MRSPRSLHLGTATDRRCVSHPCSERLVTLSGQDSPWKPEIIPTVVRQTRGVLSRRSGLSRSVAVPLHILSPIREKNSAEHRFRCSIDRTASPLPSRRGVVQRGAGVPPGNFEGGPCPRRPVGSWRGHNRDVCRPPTRSDARRAEQGGSHGEIPVLLSGPCRRRAGRAGRVPPRSVPCFRPGVCIGAEDHLIPDNGAGDLYLLGQGGFLTGIEGFRGWQPCLGGDRRKVDEVPYDQPFGDHHQWLVHRVVLTKPPHL